MEDCSDLGALSFKGFKPIPDSCSPREKLELLIEDKFLDIFPEGFESKGSVREGEEYFLEFEKPGYTKIRLGVGE